MLLLSLAGCLKNYSPSEKSGSNPELYYIKGMELLDNGDCEKAVSVFDKALDLNDDFSRAIAGQALAQAIATKQGGGTGEDMDAGMLDDKLERALSEAEGNGEEFSVYVTGIRVHANLRNMLQGDRIGHFYNAADNLRTSVREMNLPYYADFGALNYFMGKALFNEGKYGEAIEVLDKILKEKSEKWYQKATVLSRRAHDVLITESYSHLSESARSITAKETVDRAEVSALLANELQLDLLLARCGKNCGYSDKAVPFIPLDVVGHEEELGIMAVLKVHVPGLEPVYDPKAGGFLFYPDKPVTRRELALILEAVAERLGAALPEQKKQGRGTPICSDVEPADAWYDSIVSVIGAKLMKTDQTGAFRPRDFVDGTELVVVLMRLSKLFEFSDSNADD